MSDLTAAYLDRLEERLVRKLPKSQVQEHVNEVRAHLTESIATLETEENADPELAALKRISPDKLLAKNLIRARKGLDTRPGWRFVALPTILLAIYGVILVYISATENEQFAFQPTITFLHLAIPTLLLYGMVRARRLLIGPITIAFTLFFLVFIAGESIWGPFGVSDHSARLRAKTLGGFQAYIDDLENKITAGQSVRSGGTFPTDLRRGTAYLAPIPSNPQNHQIAFGIVVAREEIKGFYFLHESATEVDARSHWLQNGEGYFAYAQKQIEEQKGYLQIWKETKTGIAHLPLVGWAIATYLTPNLLGILAIGGLLIGLGSIKDRLISALWKPERLAGS